MDYARFVAASLFYLAIHNQRDAAGVEVAVRYVTKASERLALRSRLNQTAVQLLAAK